MLSVSIKQRCSALVYSKTYEHVAPLYGLVDFPLFTMTLTLRLFLIWQPLSIGVVLSKSQQQLASVRDKHTSLPMHTPCTPPLSSTYHLLAYLPLAEYLS